jgi:serine/threonine protein kinase
MFGGLGIHKSYKSFDDAIEFFFKHLKSFEFFNYGSNGVIFKAVLKPNVDSPFISPLLKGVYVILIKCMRISHQSTTIKKGNKEIRLNPVSKKEVMNEMKIQQSLFLCGIKHGYRLTPCVLGLMKPNILKKYVSNKIIDSMYDEKDLQLICMESIVSDLELSSTRNKDLMLFVIVRACQVLQCGVLHGDFFEDNVLINNKDREIIIIDFGYSEKVTPIKEINVETTIKMIDMNLKALNDRKSIKIMSWLKRAKKLIENDPTKYMNAVNLMLSTKQEFHQEYLDAIRRI